MSYIICTWLEASQIRHRAVVKMFHRRGITRWETGRNSDYIQILRDTHTNVPECPSEIIIYSPGQSHSWAALGADPPAGCPRLASWPAQGQGHVPQMPTTTLTVARTAGHQPTLQTPMLPTTTDLTFMKVTRREMQTTLIIF